MCDRGEDLVDISNWSYENVCAWLRDNGLTDFEVQTAKKFGLDGNKILVITRKDLESEPFNLAGIDIEHLYSCIENLRNSIQIKRYMKKYESNVNLNEIQNGHSKNIGYHYKTNQHQNGRTKLSQHGNGLHKNGYISDDFSVTVPLINDDSPNSRLSPTSCINGDPFPTEKFKTFVSFLYMMLGFVVSVLMLQVIHERVPSIEEDPPLPDVFFDIVPTRVEWAFTVCETNGMILTILALCVCFFHKHRFIILRRVFFMIGTLYLYRSLTMWVTTLPVPGLHFKCAPKVHGKVSVMLQRAVTLLTGGGLSVTGSHHLCGDYLFSGHTIILVLLYISIHEYSPKRLWWFHWICWLLSATGVVCILLAHDHYTIDVVIAYLLTTRLFWTYHTMCNTPVLKEAVSSNMLSRVWWYPIFIYFECNVTGGHFNGQFEWPLPWPRMVKSNRRSIIKGV